MSLKNTTEELIFPSPGLYHTLDAEVSSRIDLIEDFESGLNLKASRELRGLTFNVETTANPLFYKGTLVFAPKKNLAIDTSISNDQVLDVSLQSKLAKHTKLNIFLTSLLPKKTLDSVASLQWDNHKTNVELKALSKEQLVGVTVHHGMTQRLSMGFEGYYKNSQKSGGGSIGARYRNFFFGNHTYELCSTYNVMGDLSLSTCFTVIPRFISLASRFNINTSSMASNVEVGAQFIKTIKVQSHEVPLQLNVRTDSLHQNVVSFNVSTPICGIKLGALSVGTKFSKYGVTLSI